jgi:hypothetical protein
MQKLSPVKFALRYLIPYTRALTLSLIFAVILTPIVINKYYEWVRYKVVMKSIDIAYLVLISLFIVSVFAEQLFQFKL